MTRSLRRGESSRPQGAPGIDKITLAEVEEHGMDRLLGELAVFCHLGWSAWCVGTECPQG
jgi:hypothetical protein